MRGYDDGYNDCSSNVGDDGNSDDEDSCYDIGYEDGQDHPFDSVTYEECGDEYYSGFSDSCSAVTGNDMEICESAST
jgi:hypothetical protein